MKRVKTLMFVLAVLLAGTAFAGTPGRETQVQDPRIGPAGHYVVYLPSDYTAETSWPAIFCYHGKDGKPTTLPYRRMANDFVIIGLDYFWNSMNTASKIDQDVANIKRIVPRLAKELNLDPQQLFIAGNSAGGWLASGVAEATPSLWAGVAILGSGRYEHLRKKPALPKMGGSFIGGTAFSAPKKSSNPISLVSKPIYIGVGERDVNLWWAEKAADYYRSQGADVTFETYKGAGHGSYPSSTILKEWLLSNGPLKEAEADVSVAHQAQAAGELGKAYLKFMEAVPMIERYGILPETAAQAAESLAKDAQAKLNAAKTAVGEERYEEAVKLLSQVSVAYKGCKFGTQAGKSLILIRKDPQIKKKAKQSKLNARALALEENARRAEKAKNYATAIKLYEQYLALFKRADRYQVVKAHLESLKADPEVQVAFHRQMAERDCRNWLSMADNYIKVGKHDQAKVYLQKILDQYGDTEWGKKAKGKLERIALDV